MLRQVFYVLLGGYFVVGVLIGLNWWTGDDWGRREPTAVQEAELVPAAVQGTRTPGAESGIGVITEQVLTSQRKSGDNGEASLSPPPSLGLGRPQSSEQSLQAGQVGSRSLPTVRAVDQPSIPHPRTDQTASLSRPPIAVLQSPHPDRRTAGNSGNTLGLGRPQSSQPQS